MSRSVILYGKDAIMQVLRHGEKMWIQDIRDMYFVQKRAKLMGAGYVILEWFADPMQFLKKLFVRAGLLGNCESISLYAFLSWAHSTLSAEEALKMGANRTHWDAIFNSVISDLDNRKCEKGIGRYTSMKTVLVDHMEKPKNIVDIGLC